MITYINPEIDRSDWGPGPWDEEPDKVSWIDEATSLPCIAVRNRVGSWCGYAAVNPGHGWHGQGPDDVPAEVHGGLTFADSCNDDGPIEHSVCHVPEPGQPADVWWLGFDTSHWRDYSPGLRAFTGGPDEVEAYRTLDYVRAECAQLARQIKDHE